MKGANYKKIAQYQEYTEPQAESARASVIRTYEEIRQSLQLNNQISEHRQSQMSNRQSSTNRDRNNPSNSSNNVGRQSINQSRKYQEPNSQYKATVPEQTNEQNEKEHKVQTKEAMGMMDDHRISLDELRERYQTDYNKGFSTTKATQLNEQFGDNKLTEKEREPLWKKFLKEVANGFAIMLWVGAALCFLVYILQPSDPSNLYLGIVLVLVIFLTGYITFQQSAKSEALMESFKNFLPQQCTVIRDGSNKQIDALKLVVGDIVIMKAGEKIPADIRILMSNEMKVDNSPLTGESEPLLRTVECSHPENPLETNNLCFFGTLCKEGQGKGVVIRIGDNTTLGQIADLSSSDKKVKSPLRQELDRFVIMITIIALFLGVLFFLLAWLLMDYNILQCLIFGIGILVANVPEGLLGCITISLAITAKTLSEKNVLVKNLEAVETLGSTSCICSDKTGTLTQNVMTVEHMWYNDQIIRAKNKSLASPAEIEYDETEKGFQNLHYAAMCSSEAKFDLSQVADKENIDFIKAPVLGDATETGLVRFYQYIEDIETTRNRFKVAEHKGQPARMPFNSNVKFALTIVEQKTSDSDYCIYMKGAPEKVWLYCSNILIGDRKHEIDQEWKQKFENINKKFGKKGERVLGFSKLHLLREEYPLQSTVFNVSSPANYNFKLAGFSFCGLVSLIDPPKTRVPGAILECRSAGIKVIMVTGDQPPTAASIARQVNIIPQSVKTVDEIMESENISWEEASEKCEAIVVHGDKIVESLSREQEEGKEEFTYLRTWVKKPYCVFARTTPAQKLQIVQACQAEGYVCAVTGDGVNDSPAIKQGDIGISMNITGSDVTKDAADMILLDDDFASIVIGVEEGRKIFDNLKKTVVYLLTSNIPEIIPFLAFIIIKIPLPLSNIFMLCICVGTDLLPALSLAYEEAEIDIMTRKPRKKTDHLVSLTLITHAYLQMGMISTGAGFAAYYTTLNFFGFTPQALFGMANINGYRPQPGFSNDFPATSTTITPQINIDINLATTLFGSGQYFNEKLYNAVVSSGKNVCTGVSLPDSYTINWQLTDDGQYDLRKAFLRCNALGVFETSIPWNLECNLNYKSPVTDYPVCYSNDASFYAQTSFFVAIVLVQWSNVFACKSRKMSFCTSPVNKVMFMGILVETMLCVFLFYTPGVQKVFGARPLEFWQFGIPGLPFSIMLLLWEEFRKILLRSSKWFNKFCLW